MRVLLLHLPATRRSYLSRISLQEPLAALFLAPVLRPHHELRFVDLRITPELERALDGFLPDAAVVGVGPLTIGAASNTLARLKSLVPGIRVLLVPDAEYGNSHVAERPLDFVHPLCDALAPSVFLATLRQTVPAVLAAWERGSDLSAVPGLWIRERDGAWHATESSADRVGDIGVPDRTLLGTARGRYRFGAIGNMAHVFYTYGCKFKCRFCPMSKHDGTIQVRELTDVVRELEELIEPNVVLLDYEAFLAPEAMAVLADAVDRASIRKRWYMLTRSDTAIHEEALIARWRDLGLRWLLLGLDGSTSERLRQLRKANTVEKNEEALERMNALGIGLFVNFLVSPDFTREDFAELRRYVERLKPPLFGFSIETPLVGTQLYDDRRSDLTTQDPSLYDLGHAVLPTALPLEQFYHEMAKLHLMSGLRSLPGMARHFPVRDLVRVWAGGGGALRDVWCAAHDHGDRGQIDSHRSTDGHRGEVVRIDR